jgi:hypothetical protein
VSARPLREIEAASPTFQETTMPNVNTTLTAITLGLAVIASASPGLAKERHHAQHLYLSTEMNGDREKALRECNAEVAPYNNRDYQSTQIIRYNGCMERHGQMP